MLHNVHSLQTQLKEAKTKSPKYHVKKAFEINPEREQGSPDASLENSVNIIRQEHDESVPSNPSHPTLH